MHGIMHYLLRKMQHTTLQFKLLIIINFSNCLLKSPSHIEKPLLYFFLDTQNKTETLQQPIAVLVKQAIVCTQATSKLDSQWNNVRNNLRQHVMLKSTSMFKEIYQFHSTWETAEQSGNNKNLPRKNT